MSRALVILLLLACTACKESRVQYRTMPGFYQRMANVQGANDGETDDGTRIQWESKEEGSVEKFTDHTGQIFLMREEREDGTIELNALIAEHVMLNMLECLHNQEYQLLWDEMVAEETRQWYEQDGGGFEAYDKFFRANRRDVVAMLSRMKAGLASYELERIRIGDDRMRLRLAEQLHHRFRFTYLDTVWDGEKYWLVTIN